MPKSPIRLARALYILKAAKEYKRAITVRRYGTLGAASDVRIIPVDQYEREKGDK